MHEIAAFALPGFREPFNSFSHLFAVPVFLILGAFLVRRAGRNRAHAVSLAVFAFASVFLLTMSGVYHMLPPGAGRDVLRQLDTVGIFLLIAGTATPGYIILFSGAERWVPLTLIWTAAVVGILLRTVFPGSLPHMLGTAYFLLMGWAGAVSAILVWKRFGAAFIKPLFWGGVTYTLGAVLLELNWPVIIPGVIAPHELWHIAVLVGLGLHWRFAFQIAALPPAETAVTAWTELSTIAPESASQS
jgi:channel protein (hemolysin III family)